MVEILHHLICIYIYMHYTTRIPMLLVYEVYVWPCRISTISSMTHFLLRDSHVLPEQELHSSLWVAFKTAVKASASKNARIDCHCLLGLGLYLYLDYVDHTICVRKLSRISQPLCHKGEKETPEAPSTTVSYNAKPPKGMHR